MNEDFRIGDWLVQPSQNSLSRSGTQVKVDPKAMQVLVRLTKGRGEVVTKEDLIEVVVLALLVGLNVCGLRDRILGGTNRQIESLVVLPLEVNLP